MNNSIEENDKEHVLEALYKMSKKGIKKKSLISKFKIDKLNNYIIKNAQC